LTHKSIEKKPALVRGKEKIIEKEHNKPWVYSESTKSDLDATMEGTKETGFNTPNIDKKVMQVTRIFLSPLRHE
jgi:hypothetical protein